MASHLILEGVDVGGKTTLARKLCDLYGYGYHHESVPPKDAFFHYGRLLLRKQPTVFDRFHLGETVYGPILRGRSQLGPEELKLLQRLITATGTTVVVCRPPYATCEQRLHQKEMLTAAQRVVAYRAWLDLDRKWFHLRYDYTKVHQDFETAERFFKRPTLPAGVIGSPNARFLFVGERVNGPIDAAFFDVKGSSRFLNDALAQAGYREDEVCFTNAWDKTGRARDLSPLYLRKHRLPMNVVALGNKAWKQLKRQGTSAECVYHPAYWRRFHAKDPGYYTMILRGIRQEELGL